RTQDNLSDMFLGIRDPVDAMLDYIKRQLADFGAWLVTQRFVMPIMASVVGGTGAAMAMGSGSQAMGGGWMGNMGDMMSMGRTGYNIWQNGLSGWWNTPSSFQAPGWMPSAFTTGGGIAPSLAAGANTYGSLSLMPGQYGSAVGSSGAFMKAAPVLSFAGGALSAYGGISQLRAGNYVGGGVQTLGGGLMMASPWTGPAAPYVAAAGAVLSLIGSLIGSKKSEPYAHTIFGSQDYIKDVAGGISPRWTSPMGIHTKARHMEHDDKVAVQDAVTGYFEALFRALDEAFGISMQDVVGEHPWIMKLDRHDLKDPIAAANRLFFEHYGKIITEAAVESLQTEAAKAPVWDVLTSQAREEIKTALSGAQNLDELMGMAGGIGQTFATIQGALDQIDMVVRRSSMDEYAIAMEEVNLKWDQAKTVLEQLGVAVGKTNLEQARAVELERVRADQVNQFTDTFDSFMTSMMGSKLSPVQSIEAMQSHYDSLQAAAAGGDVGAYRDMLRFAQSDYLPFMQTYQSGEEYKSTYREVMAAASTLAASGGGMQGSAETISLLKQQNQLLAQILQSGQQPVPIVIDGRTIGYLMADQTKINGELIEAIRRAANGS
ncbi:MAG: hypothetical protein M0R18_15610, partial [Deltaproteobacteria bacterium]|nr:hypothetical protein [Deltaproteobacteria bacterium]